MEKTIKAGELYRHFKGDYYKILCIARDSDTTLEVVVYQGFYTSKEWGKNPIWVRPLDDFAGFKEIDGKKIKRFTKVEKIPED